MVNKFIRKGVYVKTANGINPSFLANRVGKVISVHTGHKPFKYRDVRVKLLDGDKSIAVYEDDTLRVITKDELKHWWMK